MIPQELINITRCPIYSRLLSNNNPKDLCDEIVGVQKVLGVNQIPEPWSGGVSSKIFNTFIKSKYRR